MSFDDDTPSQSESEDGGGWSIGEEYDAMTTSSFHAPANAIQDMDTSFEDALEFWSELSSMGSASAEGSIALRFAATVADWGSATRDSRETAAARINELLLQAPFATVFSCGACAAATEALEAITAHIALLKPLARSRVAGAILERLERLPADAFRDDEEALLHALLLTVEGEALVELKRLLSSSGPGRDLQQLVYAALSSPEIRSELLQHFRLQAEMMATRPLHVLSDVDMTVWASSSVVTGGPKFPSGPIPGALALFGSLHAQITFLSSRPPVWESKGRRSLATEAGIGEASVLPGLQVAVMALLQPGRANDQKERAFAQFTDLHPEGRLIFFGDTGESDVEFALVFMEGGLLASTLPGKRTDRIALIHDVVASDGVEPRTPERRRNELALAGVRVFDSYAGAATELFRHGFLDDAGLRHAAQSCIDEFAAVDIAEYRSPQVYDRRREELMRDLSAVNTALREVAPREDGGPSRRLSEFLAEGGALAAGARSAGDSDAVATAAPPAETATDVAEVASATTDDAEAAAKPATAAGVEFGAASSAVGVTAPIANKVVTSPAATEIEVAEEPATAVTVSGIAEVADATDATPATAAEAAAEPAMATASASAGPTAAIAADAVVATGPAIADKAATTAAVAGKVEEAASATTDAYVTD
eukprot:NODE_2412_length_2217_cov_8.366986.p1 GENE.NODE_2412_length_2217_cov_8.366986~~NODE_2412_length_2217_cov_8.366986.p1  ORF type:complete len:736 (-),score=208.03 NODE_2412_length_2217_cov_8.366986:10-1977(-)